MKRHFIRRPVIASTERGLYSLDISTGTQAKKEIEKALKAGTTYGAVNDYLNKLYNSGKITDSELSELVSYTNHACVGCSETAVKGATASKEIKASYSPMLLDELVSGYSTNDFYSLKAIWDEVFNEYGDESLADDVVDAVEAEREELGIMCNESTTDNSYTDAIKKEMDVLRRKMQKEYETRGNTQQHQEWYKRYQELENDLAGYGMSITGSTQAASGFSFDFVWDVDYNAQDIQAAIFKVFEDEFNLEVKGIDFRSVDYEDIKEYAGMNVSQCGVDFVHYGDYPADDITTVLDEELTSLGYELIGFDFYSL